MSIQNVGMKAYQSAMADFDKARRQTTGQNLTRKPAPSTSFGDTVQNSLTKVNNMQSEKSEMIQSFASGETQNVHELMVTLQKAGLAMNLTSAVRNKVMEAYKEMGRIQF